jgi:hypothetical protein
MSRKKAAKKQVKKSSTKILGRVGIQYVQINVPENQIEATVEALSHAILSEYYAQYLVTDSNSNSE